MDQREMQSDSVVWHGSGAPVSARFDEAFFSVHDGLSETRHVFLDGNRLPARFCDGFGIAELGFGTGLNAIAALDCWLKAGVAGRFTFTSFEAVPMSATDMARALAHFPELAEEAAVLVENWSKGVRSFAIGPMQLSVVIGDVRETLPAWTGQADAWFLDGFSPAKNPEMWSPDILAAVRARTVDGGSFATFTAAGAVRRGLEQAGFTVHRTKGFGNKRHMSAGHL